MISGIYTITNIVNNKLYVGYAKNFKKRWDSHKYELIANTHGNEHLQNAWNIYGESNFLFEELIQCEINFLKSEENYWCNLLNVHNPQYGYNIRPTDPHKTGNCSPESIKKMSISRTGLKQSEETGRKRIESRRLNNTLYGIRPTEESKEKNRQAHLGKKHTQESKDKMSKSQQGKRLGHIVTEETRDKISKSLMNKKNSLEFKHTPA